MDLTREQQQAIVDFVNMIKNNFKDVYTDIVTIHDNPGCGIYAKQGKEYLDIPCLAVACLKDGSWIGLHCNLGLIKLSPDQVL